jgi:hypothetical protein
VKTEVKKVRERMRRLGAERVRERMSKRDSWDIVDERASERGENEACVCIITRCKVAGRSGIWKVGKRARE